jgi:hypothetical protein
MVKITTLRKLMKKTDDSQSLERSEGGNERQAEGVDTREREKAYKDRHR